ATVAFCCAVLAPALRVEPRSGLALHYLERLDRGVFFQAISSELHSNSRLLDAAEWSIGLDRSVLIHPCRAAFEAACEIGRLLNIVRPNGTAEPIWAGICPSNRIVDIGILDDRQDRAELLFVDKTNPVGDLRDNGRLEKISCAIFRVAAGKNACAVSACVLRQCFDITQLRFVLHRPKLSLGI